MGCNFSSFRSSSFAMSQRHYKVSARRWFTLDEVILEYENKKATFNASRSVYAPAEYSYRCESVSSFRYAQLTPRTSKDAANNWRVVFDDFQVVGTVAILAVCSVQRSNIIDHKSLHTHWSNILPIQW